MKNPVNSDVRVGAPPRGPSAGSSLPAGRLAVLGATGLAVLLLALPAAGQDTNVFIPDGTYAPDATAEAVRYMVSNALAQAGEMTNAAGSNEGDQGDSSNQSNAATDTNATSEAAGQERSLRHESRSQWLDRQRAQQASASASAQARDTGRAAVAQRANAPSRPDYSAFQLVNQNNIFDPNRVRHRAGVVVHERTTRVESFSLVGTMSYEKGTFAFFDGTSSDYKKALKVADSIANYRVTKITPDTVNLVSGTNRIELHVGMQMRSEDGGDWTASTQSQAYADTSTAASHVASASGANTPATETPSSGSESDVVKRMMQRREQE